MRGSLVATDLSKPIITQNGTLDATLATQPMPTWDAANLSRCAPDVCAALTDYVETIVNACGEEIVAVVLYGSQARGDAEAESDIDLLLVVRHDSRALRRTLADLAWQIQFVHNVVISDIVRTLDEFHQMQQLRFPYFQNIEREGVLLWKNQSVPMPAFA